MRIYSLLLVYLIFCFVILGAVNGCKIEKTSHNDPKSKETAMAVADEFYNNIGSKIWSKNRPLYSDEYIQSMGEHHQDSALILIQKGMGNYYAKFLQDWECNKLTNLKETTSICFLLYNTSYQNGEAVENLTLKETNGSFKILEYNFTTNLEYPQ